MAGFGNPFSIELGGGPSQQEAAYEALRSAVGVGNSADGGPDDSVIEAWRFARARGVVASFAAERAAAQSSPLTATDMLRAYEEILRVFLPLHATEQERREALLPRYTRVVTADYPSLLGKLRAINPLADINIPDRADTRDTQLGRAFEDHNPASPKASGPAFGLVDGNSGSKCTSFPNFSTDFLMVVLSPAAGASWADVDVLSFRKIEDLLDEELPAWVDFRVYAACGFVLDQDLLDVTAFC